MFTFVVWFCCGVRMSHLWLTWGIHQSLWVFAPRSSRINFRNEWVTSFTMKERSSVINYSNILVTFSHYVARCYQAVYSANRVSHTSSRHLCFMVRCQYGLMSTKKMIVKVLTSTSGTRKMFTTFSIESNWWSTATNGGCRRGRDVVE